ncbi:hypothetical protein XO12_06195 [Marinitoga sp. 1154]|uniref:radical SAM family heme chaperone HemW n=1 Tax=Marinitoga sp. 1154 TaxID=1643335 RepID=UPI001586106B|nr:radical SAM family heme chaperone HemW [Marinitoga sp. 1154]NUU99703.1 hypothetical protein [Marinitoga sp. 1154]
MNSEIGIYIHIPFCKSKCLYCDYPSTTNINIQQKYFNYLMKDIELNKYDGKIKTVFLGGGTPSYVDIKYIENIFKKLNITNAFEITIESNPETLTEKKLYNYKMLGINRLSMGIQTFDNNILRAMNRQYNNEIIEKKFNLARKFFFNINFDFILGLPGDNMNILKKNLELIEKLQPQHVSYYIFDDNHPTPLKSLLDKGKMKLPEYEFIEDGFDLIIEELDRMGYKRYEISNWSKKGFECNHNLIYWNNENYYGYGISAGGHVNNIRYTKTSELKKYFKYLNENKIPYEYYNENTLLEELTEELFMGLRLIDGIKVKKLKTKYGKLYEKFFKKLIQMVSDLIKVDNRIRLSKKGQDLSKMVFEKILEVRENIEWI